MNPARCLSVAGKSKTVNARLAQQSRTNQERAERSRSFKRLAVAAPAVKLRPHDQAFSSCRSLPHSTFGQSMELTQQLRKTVLYGDIALSPDAAQVTWVQSTAAAAKPKQLYLSTVTGNAAAKACLFPERTASGSTVILPGRRIPRPSPSFPPRVKKTTSASSGRRMRMARIRRN